MTDGPSPDASGEAVPARVLHVLNGASGGAAESTLQLIDGLRDRGVDSVAVCHDSGTAEDRARLAAAVDGRLLITHLWWWNRRTRVAAWKRPLLDLRESVRTGRGRRSGAEVERFARDQRVDLVHTNTILTPEGARSARSVGVPHVWHLRELVGPGQPFRFWREREFFARRVAPACDVLIANSDETLRHVADWLPPGRAVVVPNGIDVDRYAGVLPPTGRTPVVVGMVANLTSRWKRHDLFVEAAGRVDPGLPARFVIVGRDPAATGGHDPYAEGLRRRVDELGLGDRFEFAGFVADPVELMARLDLLVHPCAQESFGRVALEAMAAGRPVIGADGGGIATIVEPGVTGVLVPDEDPGALAAAIAGAVADEDQRVAWGEAGRARARAAFSLAATVDGVLAAYRTALRR